jgi:peptidoglycan hydrolase-like protein with peptidoglycan-binding domain
MKRFRIAVLCAWALAAAAVSPLHALPGRPAAKAPSPQTSTSSTKKKTKKKHTKREPTQQAPTPERISEIQSALARGGYYQGDPNGKWDANTVGAVEKFQSAHGIDSSGKLDAATLQKLGLGSDTAGVSAPRPVTTPNCCSTSPSPAAGPAAQPQSSSPPSNTSSSAQSGTVSSSSTGAANPATSGSQLQRP